MITLPLLLLAAAADIGAAALRDVSSSEAGFSAVAAFPPPACVEAGDGLFYPVMRGISLSGEPDMPLVPELVLLIPVPPGAEVESRLTVLSVSEFETPAGRRPCSPPTLAGTGLESAERFQAAEDGRAFDPIEVATMRIAGVDMAVARVHPLRDPASGAYASSARIELSWRPAPGAVPLEDGLASLVCPPGVLWWPPSGGGGTTGGEFWGRPWARIGVAANGLYMMTGEMLEQEGCHVTGSSSATLRMFTGPGRQFVMSDPADSHQLSEIGIEVLDGGDGVFDAEDSILFVGLGILRFEPTPTTVERLYHRYAAANTYWLTWGGETGLRMNSASAEPDGSPGWGDSLPGRIWIEPEYVWMPRVESRTGWVEGGILFEYPGYYGFVAEAVDGPGSLDLGLVADSLGDHHILLSMNGVDFADTISKFDGEMAFHFEDVPLVSGTNTLMVKTISEGHASGGVYFNYLGVAYPRKSSSSAGCEILFDDAESGRYSFDIGPVEGSFRLVDYTDPFRPLLLTGAVLQDPSVSFSHYVSHGTRLLLADSEHLAVPVSIAPAQPGRITGILPRADVAIVSADHLMEGAVELAALMEARGIDAQCVSLQEVIDEFGQGVPDPGAVRSFFRWTQDEWSPPASHLVLVGDGHTDPLGNLGSAPPSLFAWVKIRETDGRCLDDGFVIAHEGGDLPEAPVSRIPADTPAELAVVLSKIAALQAPGSSGEWRNRMLFTADDEWGNWSQNETEHTLFCDILADSVVPPSVDREKFYLVEYPWPGSGREKPEAREDFVRTLGRGFAATFFSGHGSYGQLCHEKLFVSADIERLENGWRLPTMTFASCDVGMFDLVSADCMGEKLVLQPGGGAVSVVASTRGTTSPGNRAVFEPYYDLITSEERISPGEALWASKLLSAGFYTNNRLYVLLGDGTLPLGMPERLWETLEVEGDTLWRGRRNRVEIDRPDSATVFLTARESAAWTTYTCLGGASMDYLRYGGSAFRGAFQVSGEPLAIEFFMPVQADSGAFGRCSGPGISMDGTGVSWREWVAVADSGGYSADSAGPAIELWIDGHRGEPSPVVTQPAVLCAELEDSSGIAVFGGAAGRAILLSIDAQGFDVSRWFSYLPGSSTTGGLEYALPGLLEGPHTLILAAWDGMGNVARDTLPLSVTGAEGPLVENLVVFPNPAEGARVFSFEASSPGTVEATIYTIAGRAIWSGSAAFSQGYCQLAWNGLDSDGDAPASGPYIYRLVFASSAGRTETRQGVLAVIRDGG